MTAADTIWLPPPADLSLPDDAIHVWRVSLDQSPQQIQALRQVLTADELDRAARFHFEHDRSHFIVARGVLRHILSRYLRVRPYQLRFSYSKYGKPALDSSVVGAPLSFNVSHSRAMALYAISRASTLGVDIEYIRADFECEQIAERFFSAQENAALRTVPDHLKHIAFFNCWTRKEAYIKAIGEGLSHPLDQFDVSLVPGEPAKLLDTRSDPGAASRWLLQELLPGPGYVAALAVEGTGWNISCWQWLA